MAFAGGSRADICFAEVAPLLMHMSRPNGYVGTKGERADERINAGDGEEGWEYVICDARLFGLLYRLDFLLKERSSSLLL